MVDSLAQRRYNIHIHSKQRSEPYDASYHNPTARELRCPRLGR